MTPIMPSDQQHQHQHNHHHHGGYRRPYKEDDPSFYRRTELMGEMSDSVSVSSFFPIERYFAAADTVFAAFNKVLDQDDLDSTFVYGKRYCNFIVNEMPKHNYFQRDKYAKQRTDHQKNIVVILPHLETIKAKMDEECRAEHKRYLEQVRIEKARREQERLRQEKLQAQREAAKYQELLKRAEQQKKANKNADANGENGGGDVKQSAMNKLEMLMKKSSTTPAPAPAPNRPSGRYALSDEEDEEAYNGAGPALSIGEPLPPPLPPPSGPGSHSTSSGSLSEAPPSYNFAVKSDRPNPFLKNGSNGGMLPSAVPPPVQTWGDARPPSYNSVSGTSSLPDPPTRRYPSQQQYQQHHQQQPAAKRPKKIPMRQLRERAKQMYQKLIQDKRIEIRSVDTYQGRYSRSTNGCTVISPLVVAHHLASPIGMLVTDQEIKYVIDDECGPLLREIRGKLGLESGSLIIPSDVHDHLVDKNILKQDYFVGATGGNIVGQEHKNEFIKLFKEKQKAGAALFFREHVVSIVKTPIGNGKAYYDLVDSMPGTNDARGNPCASRTRCMDEQAFDVLLTWYATKKFSEGNCSYIDKNDWNDNMADLDPRVFQAFVWGKDM